MPSTRAHVPSVCSRLPIARRRICRAAVLLAGLLSLALLSSCRSSPWQRELFAVESGTAVYLETRHDEEGLPVPLGLSHPLDLAEEDVAHFLASLSYTRERLFFGETGRRIFEPRAARRLAGMVCGALCSAGPDQRVRFLSLRSERELMIFPTYRGTSGAVFAPAPDRIEIAFGDIDRELPVDDGDPRKVRFRVEPTELVDSKTRVLPPEGIRLRPLEGAGDPGAQPGFHPCWLSVSPAEIRALALAQAPLESPGGGDGDAGRSGVVAAAGTPVRAPGGEAAPRAGAFREVARFQGFIIVQSGDLYYALPERSTVDGDGHPPYSGKTPGEVIDQILAAGGRGESPPDGAQKD